MLKRLGLQNLPVRVLKEQKWVFNLKINSFYFYNFYKNFIIHLNLII